MTSMGSPPGSRVFTAVTADPLDVTALIGRASSPEAGGLGIFVGTVRTSAAVPGRQEAPVVRLEYEAHPALAEQRLASIAEDAAKKWSLERVVAVHRTGPCDVGEPTVVIVCAAPHRGDALEACRHVIDTIKDTVPIWKREVYADGSSWVGAEGT